VAVQAQRLRDRAAALAGELIALKNQAALAGDDELNVRLKEVRRIIKPLRGGQVFSEEAYDRLVERIANELFEGALAEEDAVQARKERLTETVRRQVEAELEAERAELGTVAAALQDRELAVTAREKQASPPYRAAFVTAGAFFALSADLLVRVVA
jgi:hypothetical protein